MPHLTIGLKKIAYDVRTSPRAKRLRLTVRPEGVEVVVPPRVPAREINAFIDSHRGWIRAKVEAFQALLDSHAGPERLEDGATIMFRGEPTPLAIGFSDRVRPKVVEGDGFRLELPSRLRPEEHESAIERTLVNHLKKQAKSDAQMAIEQFGPPHGLEPSALHIKDQKRLWGSCTYAGVINLNWRLIFAPAAVFDYVVVHELCHLRHRHHQPPFWRMVGEVMPGFERHRRWLKQNGHLLTLKRPGGGQLSG
ncbi:MAG: SprT family zinc-dependent metalloprotease [Alphaproteobacteria bacterium]